MSEMVLLKASASLLPVPTPSQTDSLITAALRDLTSKVTSLATRPPPASHAPSGSVPPPPPPSIKKPLLILSHQGNSRVHSADFSILVLDQWYGSPVTYTRDNNDSHEADIFFASVNPGSGEASKILKKETFPTSISQHFNPGPPAGYTIAPSSLPPKSKSWAQAAISSKKAGKCATAAQVAFPSATKNSEVGKPCPPLPTARHPFYAPRLHPASFVNPLNMSATLPDIIASVLQSAGCTLPVTFSTSVNVNGALTLTANPRSPSSAYAPIFPALSKKLNQSFAVGENPFQELRTAPLFTDVLIHNLPF